MLKQMQFEISDRKLQDVSVFHLKVSIPMEKFELTIYEAHCRVINPLLHKEPCGGLWNCRSIWGASFPWLNFC